MAIVTRRQLFAGTAGAVGLLTLGACSPNKPVARTSTSTSVVSAQTARPPAGQRTVTAQLTPRLVTLDLGGPKVSTWAYGDQLPGPLLRARAGDQLRIAVVNQLPADTSIHWHGIALRNDMDGVPGMTQKPIGAGQQFTYEFTAPDPGTYFYHPHVGVQLDRGLYGVLLVDDPREPGHYDAEWTVVLDDWIDGTGRSPDQVLANLATGSPAGSGSGGAPGTAAGPSTPGMDGPDMGGMAGMGGTGTTSGAGGMGGMGMGMGMGEAMTSAVLGGAGDISYPHYLANGRIPASPQTFQARPGDKIRLRLINAGSDTAFRVALGGHRMTVTHTDGFPVSPAITDALIIGMGERFDVEVTAADGVFPLVAVAEGKTGQALTLLRTGSGRAPAATIRPVELTRQLLLGNDLRATAAVALADKNTDRSHDLTLGGSMSPYRWTINGQAFPAATPLPVVQGERVRLRMVNRTMMFHPMHLHGHTFAVTGGGPRKDTVIVRPMRTVEVDLDADNPGQWAAHCHNIYHAERGMMTSLAYLR